MIGITIGSYEITDRIGSGGVGDVYRATDPLLGRTVAIKFLRPGLADRAEVVSRFHAEARTLAQLIHPNIALLYCLLREGPHLGMVMEYVEGRTFAEILRSSGRLPPERALPLVFQALEGIGHAHRAGVVHRDIKASNLMLATSGCVKVMDFGIARCLGTDRATRHGHMVGTVQYMSPEQVRGGETDARSDVYALGVLLYELLCGELPFDSENEYELCRAQVEEPPRRPRAVVPELSDVLEAVVLRALAKDPSERFSDVRALRDSLESASPRATQTRFSIDRDAPPTRELALEDAERIALRGTRAFPPASPPVSAPLRTSRAPSRDALREPAPSARVAAPRRAGPFAAAACALLVMLALGGVRLVRFEARAAPAVEAKAPPPRPAHAPPPKPPSPAPGAEAVAPPKTVSMARPAARRLPSKTPAEGPQETPGGENGWVIRRR